MARRNTTSALTNPIIVGFLLAELDQHVTTISTVSAETAEGGDVERARILLEPRLALLGQCRAEIAAGVEVPDGTST